MFGDFLSFFEEGHIQSKTVVATFRASFGETWATFYSNIWSHWLEGNNSNEKISFDSKTKTCADGQNKKAKSWLTHWSVDRV